MKGTRTTYYHNVYKPPQFFIVHIYMYIIIQTCKHAKYDGGGRWCSSVSEFCVLTLTSKYTEKSGVDGMYYRTFK